MSSSVVRELVTLWGFEIDQQPLKELDAGINVVKSSLKGIIVGLGAAAAGVGFLLNEAGGEEQTLIAFETMLGSLEKGQKLLNEIKDFADVTPFNTDEVVAVGKKLLAFGIEEDKIIEKTERLGNIASGVGKDKFPSLILAFGKIKTKGKATMEELNILLEAGVPILDELAKNMNVTKQEMFKMVSTGKVGFKEVDDAIRTMSTGSGKFAGLMAKQSKSFFGLMSTIQGQLLNFAKEIGKELLPMAKEITSGFLEWFAANRKLIRQNSIVFVKNLVGFMGGLVNILKTAFRAMTGLVNIFGGWNKVLNSSFKVFSAIMGLGLLTGIGLLVQGLIGLAGAWATMGNAALFAQLKLIAIPLAIGAIVAAIALIAEDIFAFSEGRDSVFGRMLAGVTDIFSQMEEKFKAFGKIGKLLVTLLLTPVRVIINGFKSLLTLIDIARGKVGVMEGLKKIGANTLSNLGIGTGEGLTGALGISNSLSQAQEIARAKNNPIAGLGPLAGGQAKKAQDQKIENTLNLNVTGMTEEAGKALVLEKVNENFNGVLRQTERDGESQIER